MTAQRRKMNRTALFLCVVAHGAALGALPVMGGTSERVVAGRFSGLAMSGFDPVAYFTDGSPRQGRDDIELSDGGAVWRFRNPANRESFAARPDIYAPAFGGHDPIDVARGVARAGRTQIWLIADQRLYLFADEDNRDAFAAAVASSRRAALEAWPAIEVLLAQ